MASATTSRYITSIDQLRDVIQAPKPDSVVMQKQLATLDDHCRAFIDKSPFMLFATADASGRCDVSPRGDGQGFVKVLDDATVVVPDRPGNRRIDSMQNIIENPHAGMLFLVPGVDETLRVNGRAAITDDPGLLESMLMRGKAPLLGIVIQVEEVFFHCARSFKRAALWEPDSWIKREELPSLGTIIADQVKSAKLQGADVDRSLAESNKRLY